MCETDLREDDALDLVTAVCRIVNDNVRDGIHAAAARACGWSFGKAEARVELDRYSVKLSMTCLCDRTETFQWEGQRIELDALAKEGILEKAVWADLVQCFYHHGSFSEAHLLNDHYPPEFAARVSRRYEFVLGALEAIQDIERHKPIKPGRRGGLSRTIYDALRFGHQRMPDYS